MPNPRRYSVAKEIEIPAGTKIDRRGRAKLFPQIDEIAVGESFMVPHFHLTKQMKDEKVHTKAFNLRQAVQVVKRHSTKDFTTRMVKSGCRIWRTK